MPKNSNAGDKHWVDPDDAPELDADYFERADVYVGERLVKRGRRNVRAGDAPDLSSPKYRIKLASAPVKRKRGRPKLASPKKMLSLRLDQEVIDSLRASGPGWQRRANDMLRNALKVG
jgi:uncharacterized protein (DUF4415 family)